MSRRFAAAVIVCALGANSYAKKNEFPFSVTLKRAWVKKHKNRATISAKFIIDCAHPKPNRPEDDGDIHVAGRSPQDIGLPAVAELMNAAKPEAKQVAKQVADNNPCQRVPAKKAIGSSAPMATVGVWRLWFEHPAKQQVQFEDVDRFKGTNPPHSFEIHPITELANKEALGSLKAIPGFDPKDTEKAFKEYKGRNVRVEANHSAIRLSTKSVGMNYAAFRLRLLGEPQEMDDGGRVVLGEVQDCAGDEHASNIRMVFVKDTPPFKALQGKGVEDELEVIGIPRVSLKEVWDFVEANGGVLDQRKIPYEMIIVAVLSKTDSVCH